MKILSSLFLVFLLQFRLFAQTNQDDLKIITRIAENIIGNTNYTIIESETQTPYKSAAKLQANKQYKLGSEYLNWQYCNGVINLSMLQLSEYTSDPKYKNHVQNNYDFVFSNLDFFHSLYNAGITKTGMDEFFRMNMLDDCGSMAAALVEAEFYSRFPSSHEYIDKVAGYILTKETRLEDGTLARSGPYDKTLWLDDLYMSVPFLARYAKLTGKQEYFDFAAKQIIQFNNYLFDKNTNLYYHCYFTPLKETGVAHWGRANGWCILAQANLLEALPKDYPLRDTLIAIFQQQVNGLARYQSESGLWHQLLDKSDSYLETSCSAMFTYAVAKGVNNGWLDKNYKTIALLGWEGLKNKIQADGQVRDICVGTWIQNDLVFYYKRPTLLNDPHGLGVVIMAGIEILKLN